MNKQPGLSVLLHKLKDLIMIVEPHFDSETDVAAHEAAVNLVYKLVEYADGNITLKQVSNSYYRLDDHESASNE